MAASLDIWLALRRYLLVGGVDRIPARSAPFTLADAGPVRAALAADSLRVVAEVLAATITPPARPEPMLLALALASASDDDLTRRAALTALPRVARSSRDLFLFATFVQGLRGWGRGLRRAIGSWYNDRPAADLVDDVLTTPADAGWRHADLLRLGHPKAPTPTHDLIYRWLATGTLPGDTPIDPAESDADRILTRLTAASQLADEGNPDRAAALIVAHRLPLAAVPASLRGAPAVWRALLPGLPVAELLTNLPELASRGCLEADPALLGAVRHRLGDGEAIVRARIQPLAVVAARRSYEAGHRQGRRWPVDPDLVRSLGWTFDHACGRVKLPSGSFRLTVPAVWDASRAGGADADALSPIDVAATFAIVLVRAEADVAVRVSGAEDRPLRIGATDGLDEVAAAIRRLNRGAERSADRPDPLALQATRSGGVLRTVEVWPVASPADLATAGDAADPVAIHGIDKHLVETVLTLLRDST